MCLCVIKKVISIFLWNTEISNRSLLQLKSFPTQSEAKGLINKKSNLKSPVHFFLPQIIVRLDEFHIGTITWLWRQVLYIKQHYRARKKTKSEKETPKRLIFLAVIRFQSLLFHPCLFKSLTSTKKLQPTSVYAKKTTLTDQTSTSKSSNKGIQKDVHRL